MKYNIGNKEGILIHEKGNCSKLKGEKLKTKKSLKIILWGRRKSTQYNQQTESKQSKSDVQEICIYQNRESGHYTQHLYLKINGGFHARKNPKQQ